MHSDIFTQLSLVLVLSVAISFVMRFLRQPLIIGYILTGIIIGPSVLHAIDSPEAFETFADLGVALLLFITGLGLNTRVVREVGKVAVIAGFSQIVIIGLLGLSMAKLLHFNTAEALIVGMALTFGSTIIVVKLINDRREQSRLYAKIAIGLLLVEDLAATITLVILAATQTGESFSAMSLIWLATKGLLLGGALAFVSTKIIPRMTAMLASSQEFLFLFALGWGLGIATLFQKIGFSIEVGALFAGIALAALPYSQEVASRLKPLRDFFIVVFFIALGENLEFGHIADALWPALAFSALVMFAKPLLIMGAMGLLGYTKKTSFSTGITLDQISEFSLILVVLGNQLGFVSQHAVVVMTLVALITITFSTYMIMYSDTIYALAEKRLKLFERRVIEYDQEGSANKFDIALFGYRKGGAEFIKAFRAMKKKFVVIDYDPDVIETLEQQHLHYLYGDITDVELLNEVQLHKTKLVVSTITDHQTNVFLVKYIMAQNPKAVVICHSDTTDDAVELYDLGATYVMMPHHIGSEKISSFIKRNGFNKSEFKHHRDKHLSHLQSLIG